ncbi:MAG: hypothetical protein JO107_16960 [Hyphomicrobiales bacterium]|nr:hypothetical protein [Hyphomicrobiales bacterium]MBV8664777.1 hypothetical protein [Hyphomicrobiales bacterium]
MQDQPTGAAVGAPQDADQQNVSVLNVPMFYASMLNVYLPGNDATVMFMRAHPAASAATPENTALAVAEPVAVVQMSVHTLKDLYLAIKSQVEQYEKEFGEIVTVYSRDFGKQK